MLHQTESSMRTVRRIEAKLAPIFIDKAPKLPIKAKKLLIVCLPGLALLSSVFAFYSVYSLWQWAHQPSGAGMYVQQLCKAYTDQTAGACTTAVSSRLTFWVWLGLSISFIQGILYGMAFPKLRRRLEFGWYILLACVFGDILYVICDVFTEYGSNTDVLGSIVGIIISLWILFQIRGAYTREPVAK
ncbi:hypothetical protein H7097_02770 [Aeromicrobium sp.]|nr:hypothetical protein [Candidatus Saccharibacteria bacterium]